MPNLTNRDMRQRALIPSTKLAKTAAMVVGVGAIGRQVATQLAAIGVPELMLVDFDSVEEVNLAAQGYWPENLGQSKTTATADLCRKILPGIAVSQEIKAVKKSSMLNFAQIMENFEYSAIFSCVDSFAARRHLGNLMLECFLPNLFVDGRMAGENVEVRAFSSDGDYIRDHKEWSDTLADDRDAYAGTCTSRSTIFTASLAAALMVLQLSKYFRGLPIKKMILCNLLACELKSI